MGELYTVGSGIGLSAGRWRGSSGPVGVWGQLSIAPHSRKVIGSTGAGNVPFSYARTAAVEALTPQTVSAIPYRGYCVLVRGEHNTFYIHGSLHSGYPGNEIDRMAFPVGADTTIETTISHQPNVPPEGIFSGYGAGGSGYIYKQTYGETIGFETQEAAANWQPYARHTWCCASWTPYWGYCFINTHAKQSSYPDGAYIITDGVLQSSIATPADGVGSTITEMHGVVAFDWQAGKYKTHIASADMVWPFNTDLGKTGFSDWNPYIQEILFCNSKSGNMNVAAWRPAYGVVKLADMNTSPTDPTYANCAISGIGSADNTGNDGMLFRHMECGKYLWLRQVGTGRSGIGVFLYSESFGLRQNRIVDLTASLPGSGSGEPFNGCSTTQDVLTFSIDRNSRRIFWIIHPGGLQALRFYTATFDAPMTWTPLPVTITPALAMPDFYLGLNRQPIHFSNGYLYIQDDSITNPSDPGYLQGAYTYRRAKVDAGEDLPAMAFQRFDQRQQPSTYHPGVPFFTYSTADYLQTWGNKHTNWAKRKTTGVHYVCGGDHGSNYNTGMASLTFDGTARGFTFSEVMSETQAQSQAAGHYRPVSPDDGGWFYSSNSNPNAAFRDKFIYCRGGQGTGFAGNAEVRAAYAAYATNPTEWLANQYSTDAGALAKMVEDGWTDERIVIYHPDGNYFSLTGVQSWPWNCGSVSLTHPCTLSSDTSRCAAFDEATNCIFRFTNYNGSLFLVRYDLTNQTIRGWACNKWIDTGGLMGPADRTWFTDSLPPPTTGLVTANGFGWYSSDDGRWRTAGPNAWEHKAVWINPADGKLYCVSPATGFLWCFETRGAETDAGADGLRIPFYPLGERVPLVGTYPPLSTANRYPPVLWNEPGSGSNGDVAMGSYLVPFKGGLLWWSNSHITGGAFGYPTFAFWRRLGNTGPWSVVSFPQEFAGNAYSTDRLTIDNAEVVFLAGGGNGYDTQGPWPFFWKLT